MLIFILETRLLASRAVDLKEQLRYNSVHGVDSNGLSGGIWMIWDSLRISVDILPHGSHAIHSLVLRKLLCRIPQVKMEHVFRKANSIADHLLKLGLDVLPGIHFFDVAPPTCNLSIFSDLRSTSFPRICNSVGFQFHPP